MPPTPLATPMTMALWSSIQDLTSPPKEEPAHWPCSTRKRLARGG